MRSSLYWSIFQQLSRKAKMALRAALTVSGHFDHWSALVKIIYINLFIMEISMM